MRADREINSKTVILIEPTEEKNVLPKDTAVYGGNATFVSTSP